MPGTGPEALAYLTSEAGGVCLQSWHMPIVFIAAKAGARVCLFLVRKYRQSCEMLLTAEVGAGWGGVAGG